jgi:hypothetical protein
MEESNEKTRRNFELFIAIVSGESFRNAAKRVGISSARSAQILESTKWNIIKDQGDVIPIFDVGRLAGMRMSASEWILKAEKTFKNTTGLNL